MGLFSKDIQSLDDLFKHALEDLYYAENQIVKALPDMIEKATHAELKASFEKHREETEGQIDRLGQVFEQLQLEPQGEKCPAIDGIIDETNEIAGEISDKVVLNAALIAAAQAVEHYEITRYGTLVAWSMALGRADLGKLFAANLKEEKATDKKLNGIAKRKINRKAVARRTKPMSRRDEAVMAAASAGIPSI